MKKLQKLCFIALAFSTLIMLQSCEQQELISSSDSIESNEIVHDLSSMNIRVEDQTLVFESAEDYYRAIEIVRNMDRGQLDAWEQSIGFTSTRNWYNQAIDDLESDMRSAELKTKYSGKIYFDEAEEIDLLYGLYHIGTFLNQDGIVRIENAIIKYTRDRLISIPDGNLDKLEKAMTMTRDDVSEGIYVHDLRVSDPARTCNTWYATTTVERTAGGKRYRLKGVYDFIDNGFADQYNNFYINYIFIVKVKHQKKKVFWKCHRTNVLWAGIYEVSHNLGGLGIPNPVTGYPSSIYYECDINYSTNAIYYGPVSQGVYTSRSVTPQRLRQGASVNYPADIYQNQDCQ